MTSALLYSATGVVLFGIGLLGLIVAPHIIKKVLAINIAGIGVFMIFVANAAGTDGVTDPVPHAMVLTGIVVAIAGTALALSLACKIKALGPAADKDGT
jgi:multicomponent Na+:H+ antiporter subunit C